MIYQKPHPVFQRDQQDLRMKFKITLEEALLGFSKEIKHLDGRLLRIQRDQITQPGETQVIKEEGMPFQKNPRRRGNLFIEYVVVFPKEFTDEQLDRNHLLLRNHLIDCRRGGIKCLLSKALPSP